MVTTLTIIFTLNFTKLPIRFQHMLNHHMVCSFPGVHKLQIYKQSESRNKNNI